MRQIPDTQVLAAAAEVVARRGRKLTLADVAVESGIAAATLVQRFGSKRGLLLAMTAQRDGVADRFAAMRAIHGSPLEALVSSLADSAAALAPDPITLLHRLASQQENLCDPDFHRFLLAEHVRSDEQIRDLLDEALAWGELRQCDTAALARALHAAYEGSLLQWAMLREGEAGDWVRRQLEFLLAPYRP